MIYLILNLLSVQAAFIYLEDKIYQQFDRQIMDFSKLKTSYYYYDPRICGDLKSTNFNLGFWFQFKASPKPQILLQTQFFAISMDLKLLYVYYSDSQIKQYPFSLDQTNWLFFNFSQSAQTQTLYLYDGQQNQENFYVEFLGYSAFLSLFETNIKTFDGWQGQAEQLRLITEVNFQSRDYYNYITLSTLQLKTLLLLEFEEKKQTKLLKDKSNFDYEVILGGSYDIRIDADDPILDLSDQSFKFESSKFLTIPNFYLPSTFTIQFKLGLSDLNIPQFTLLTLVQQEIDLLIIEYLVEGYLIITLDSFPFIFLIDITQNYLMIQIFFVEIFDRLNGNSYWCKFYQIGLDGSLKMFADASFPYINLNQKYSSKLLIGHQNNNIPEGSYFKLYEIKISQGVFYMENNYAANCLLFVDSRCEICSSPYIVDYDGTCQSQCSSKYIFNSFHNKCIKKCHTLCETCLDTDPTQCLVCAGDRTNPPSCGCISGFEDNVSPNCKQYLKDISVQVGIIEGTCTPPSNTFTQLFQQPYQTAPKVVLSLIGLYESMNQKKFAIYNSKIEHDSFELKAECDKEIYFQILWISKNFIDSIQTSHSENMNTFSSYLIPQVSTGNSQYDTFIGWEYAQVYSSSYISRYNEESSKIQTHSQNLYNLTYQTFQYANFQSITLNSLISIDGNNYNEQTQNYFGTAGASSKWNFDFPESIDYFYFLWEFQGDNEIKLITKANITTFHQLQITKIKQGNDQFTNDKFTIFILATKCQTGICDYYQSMNDQFNPASLTSICQKGYFSDGQTCQPCDVNCYECSDNANTCVSCLASQFKQLDFSTSTCICIDGYFLNEANTCQLCDSNCLTCQNSPTECTSCGSAQYPYIYLLNSKCVDCHKTCSSCYGPQVTECTVCIKNMTINEKFLCVCKEGYFEEQPSKCTECKQTCKSCENGNQCKECLNGLNRKLDNSNQCSCEKGFYEVNQECQRCMKTCVTCNNVKHTSCTSCDQETRELLKGVCQCKDGYFQNGLGECISCESVEAQSVKSCNYKNCSDKVWTIGEECDDGNNDARDGCTNCQIDPNYKCVNELLKPSFCYTCPDNCKSCKLEGDLIVCQECRDGYFVYESQCKKCSVSCRTCESLTFCKTCQMQSFIPNEIGKCPVCEDIPGLYTQGSQCAPKCGDGILYEATEACDDGNTTSGDGCDSSCQKEKSFNCIGGVCEKVEAPKVEAAYTNATTKNDIFLSLPKNQKDPCANITITIDLFNDTEFQSNFKFDNPSESQQCNIDFTFLKTIDESNLIHLFVPIVDDEDNTNSTSRRLSEAETREVVITPRKQIYYSESQKAQAKTAQSAQDTFGTSLYIIGPAAIMLGGFKFFWTIMDILSWLNNLYYFNIYFPENVGILFQKAAWGDLEIIPLTVEFNQESDPYYTESPLKFMEKGVDPVFLNNTWMCFSIISITLLIYIVSIVLYSCLACYMSLKQNIKTKITTIQVFKLNENCDSRQHSKSVKVKYEFQGFLKKVFVKVKDYKISIAGYLIKSLNLGILDLILAITLQLTYFKFDQYQYLDILVNSSVCYLSIILVCIILWFQYQVTNQHFLLLSDKRYEAKFGTLYEGINVKSKLAMRYSFFNLVRKALYIIFLIIFYENPIIQTLCCCLISFINVGLIIYENPFTSKTVLTQNGIPDFCIFSLTLISTGIALDDRIGYLDATQRFNIGWVMISFIGLSILTQLVFLMKELCSDLYCKYIYLRDKFKNYRSQK